MNNDVQNVIQQADLLIKEGKFNSAWKLLLPYKSDPIARKRLVWLEQKRQQASQAGKKVKSPSNPRQRNWLYLLITVVIILGLSSLVIYGVSKQEPVPAVDTTQVVVGSTASVSATSSAVPSATATNIPPTEDLKEVSLQQQLRDWLATVDGVSKVLSFDVDIPTDAPPLVYVEILVTAGHNDTHIPELLVQKLNETLNTTQYSDFLIIINENQRTIEYSFDPVNNTWEQTQLSST